jgi:sugar lactone lactonase YvrE
MDLSIDAILHIFFRLSPFILVCFFSLYSIFNKNVKGIIYLAGLLLACFVTILFGNFPELQKMDKTTGFPVTALNKSCRMIEFAETGPISYLPLGQTVLAYTLFFIGYPIIMDDFTKMNFNSRNITILLFFIILIVADFMWNFSKNCFGIISLLVSLIIGGIIGLLWGYVIEQSGNNLQLFRDTSTSKSCDTKSKQKHRCRPKVDTKIYPVNAINSTYISSICSDIAGNLYICSNENGNGIIRKLTYYYPDSANPTISQLFSNSIIAGSLEPDNENSNTTALKNIGGIYADNNGNIYFTEKDNHVIWKIDTEGKKSIIAGKSGKSGKSGDGGLATSSTLSYPTGICQDTVGNIFFSDTGNNVVKRIDKNGVINLFSGNYGNIDNLLGDDNIQANKKNVFFQSPTGICIDSNDNIYISDTGNNRIRIINSLTNIISSFSQSTDGQLNISKPTDIVVHTNGNITVLNSTKIYTFDIKHKKMNDMNGVNICIDKQNNNNFLYVDANKSNITKYLQTTTITYSYDILSSPQGMCFNNVDKSIYVCDTNNHVIRRLDPNMNLTTFGGIVGKPTQLIEDKNQTISNYVVNVKENVSALQTTLHTPTDICTDNNGNIYVTDSSNNVIRKIDTKGIITTRGGNGNDHIESLVSAGTDQSKKDTINASELSSPIGICVDSEGNVYVTELREHTIKKININGTVTIFAGITNKTGSDDGNISAGIATFNKPSSLFIHKNDEIFVIDNDKKNIRKISNGMVSTISTGSTYPIQKIYVDDANNIYITTTNNTVEVIPPTDTNGKITYDVSKSQIVTGGTDGNTGNTIAKNAKLSNPMGICKNDKNNLFIVDSNNNVIRKTYQNTHFVSKP